MHELSTTEGGQEEMSEISSELVEKKCDSLEKAQQEAGAEAANTGAFPFPVVTFRQGARINITGALPMFFIRTRLETKSSGRQSQMSHARLAWNRPEDQSHSRSIAKYLAENHNKKYIVPPMTLNIQQKVNLYTVDYPSEIRPGYLVIPPTAKLAITDGQHRKSGIELAFDGIPEEQAEEFSKDSIAVMITCEKDIDQIHQDFADCSKTKALPRSLLAVYDRRNPANRLVADLERKCALFEGRIDSTSKTLSKKSIFLFLANQLRQFVKELLAGSYALADQDFEKRATELLGTDKQYQDVLGKYVEYVNYLTEVIPVWADISKVPVDTLEASQIPRKREEGWVCLTATGLNLLGRVGHELFTHGASNWKQYADKLGQIDWRRDADFWKDNIIRGNRVMNQQGPMKAAFDCLCDVIGWKKPAK